MSWSKDQGQARRKALALVETLEEEAYIKLGNDYPALTGFYKAVLWTLVNKITAGYLVDEVDVNKLVVDNLEWALRQIGGDDD